MADVAVVPLNWLHLAKSRLAGTSADRPTLVWDMFVNVVRALVACPGLEAVAVVTPQLDLEPPIAELGAVFLAQLEGGLNPALEVGRRWALGRGASGLLVVLGDLPWLVTAEIDALVAQAPTLGVVLAPDRDQLGTNALLTRPPEAMPFCFGEHSFPRHLEAARLARLEVAVYESRGTRADVDLPSQWEELAWKPV